MTGETHVVRFQEQTGSPVKVEVKSESRGESSQFSVTLVLKVVNFI
jgi:hypothetical protein